MEPQEGARPEKAHSDDFRMYEYKVSVRGAPLLFKMPAAGPPRGPLLSLPSGILRWNGCLQFSETRYIAAQGAEASWVMWSGV